tara:strand:+ start:88 stop:909 length:822 start_codon:yes stop_codon:yes gene_type:complete
MALLNIHESIYKKLNYFIEENKIPHIIFHGPSGRGKRSIINNFINKIYNNDKQKIAQYAMFVNCAHSKGIRFIRDEIKFFAKTNINNKSNISFKSIILFNADNLTTDAQSALRRCIEKFSHTTRFFIIVENENRLLKPILSRFCNIYIPYPSLENENKKMNLYEYKKKYIENNEYLRKRNIWLKNNIKNQKNYKTNQKCILFVDILYNKGYSGLDIIKIIEENTFQKNKNKFRYLIYFDKIRTEFRNEKLYMFTILNLFFMRKNLNLENILEM